MSFSSTVDSRYRLIAADLGGRARSVMVTRVSYQGVENLQPMLHFEGIPKPLALDATQRLVVSQIARSTAVSDWVGLMMELHPVEQDQRSWIEITPVGAKRVKARSMAQPLDTQTRRVEPTKPSETSQPRRTVENGANEKVRQSPNDPQPIKTSTPWFNPDVLPQASIWTPILLGILVILAFVAVFQLETNDGAWQWFSGWFGR